METSSSIGLFIASDINRNFGGWWPAYPVAHVCLLLADVGLLPNAVIATPAAVAAMCFSAWPAANI